MKTKIQISEYHTFGVIQNNQKLIMGKFQLIYIFSKTVVKIINHVRIRFTIKRFHVLSPLFIRIYLTKKKG